MLKTYFINSTEANYTDEELSWFQKFLLSAGIIGDSSGNLGFAVTANSPAAMNVLVAIGQALVSITKDSRTFKVVVENSAQATVTVPANSSGANRVDAIIIRVDKDAEPNALKNNIATIELVTGTGTSALSDAAITSAVGSDGWVRLANITVSNGATSIVSGDIADVRTKIAFNSAVTVSSGASYNPLAASAQATPDMTIAVTAGVVNIAGVTVKYAGGNSSTFTAPVSNKRIDLLCLNMSGALEIVQGVSGSSPSAPAYPQNKYVICEVYLRNTSTSIKSTDDTSNGYIYRDCRPFYQDGYDFGDGSDGALSISSGTTTIDLQSKEYVVKKYTSISITGTGALAFSNPATRGTLIRFKVQGDVTISSNANPTIDLNSLGCSSGYVPSSLFGCGFQIGISASKPNYCDRQGGIIGHGMIKESFNTKDTYNLICPSSGNATHYNWCGSGVGGRGAGYLLMEIGGNYTFGASSVIRAIGAVGGNGCTNYDTGGGGGGAGGTVIVLVRGTISDSGTYTLTGGAGGNGGGVNSSAGANSGTGAGGGANRYSGGYGGGHNTAGGAGENDDGSGGSGGSGKMNTGGGGGGAGGWKMIKNI